MYGPFKKTWGFGHPGGFRYRAAAACHLRKPGAEKSQLGVQLVKCWLFDHLQGLPKALNVGMQNTLRMGRRKNLDNLDRHLSCQGILIDSVYT